MLAAAEVYSQHQGVSRVACSKQHQDNAKRRIFCGKSAFHS